MPTFLVLGTPELDAGLQVGSPEGRAEGQNLLTCLADDCFGYRPGYSWISGLWMHIAGSCHACCATKSLCSGLLSIHSPPSLSLCYGIDPPAIPGLALGLVELHKAHKSPPHQSGQVPWDGTLSSSVLTSCYENQGKQIFLAHFTWDRKLQFQKISKADHLELQLWSVVYRGTATVIV